MSRIYIHSRKYRSRNRRLAALVGLDFVLSLAIVSVKLYFRYQNIHQTTYSTINNSAVPLTGYINPYFMFKDSSKWVQDKAMSGPDEVVYYQYVDGTAVRQLSVYINKTPTPTQLSSTRVLPVQVLNGDSLAAGSLSSSCGAGQAQTKRGVKEISFNGVTMVCDPSPSAYSVVFAEQSGSYELHMSRSKTPEKFIILYKDFSGHPDAQNIINIANSFKVI
jgi:hypothetical protein